LAITETELNVMAALATIGLRRRLAVSLVDGRFTVRALAETAA
jgi:hypothetical protein